MNTPANGLESDGIPNQSGNRFIEVKITSQDLLNIQIAEEWLENQYKFSLFPENIEKSTIDRFDSPGAETLMLQGIPGRSSNSTPSILNHIFFNETTPDTVTSSNWMDISPLSAYDLGLHVSDCIFPDETAAHSRAHSRSNSRPNSRVNTPGMEVLRTDTFNATTSDSLYTTDSHDLAQDKPQATT